MAIQRKREERAVIPGDRPLRALTREELLARFESALVKHDGVAGAHCRQACIGLVMSALALTCIAGCSDPVLHGYTKVQNSDQYIPETIRQAVIRQRLTREQVIQQLGEPDGGFQDPRSISYTRCVTSTGWGVFGAGAVENCQRAAFWFDETGHANAQSSSIARCAFGKCEWAPEH